MTNIKIGQERNHSYTKPKYGYTRDYFLRE